MAQAWYEAYAKRFGGYQKLYDSYMDGEDGEAAFTAWLRQSIPCYPRVLDVGCGDGLFTLHMSALAEQITGIDYAPEMITMARRHQQAAAILNADFHVADTSGGYLPFDDQQFDLVFSRRGPSSHLKDARRVLRPGGLVAGLHTGARDRIVERLQKAGYRMLQMDEFQGVEILPSLEDYALYLSRIPGFEDFTHPERWLAVELRAAESRTDRGYEIPRWWFLWVAEAP